MTQRSPRATEVARLLWTQAAGHSDSPEDVIAGAERACIQLRAGLGRWIGAMGYRALLDRGLVLARADHPALGTLSCYGGDEEMLAVAVRTYGATEVANGMVALVSALVELLGRIIGDEMALRLVEQTGVPAGSEAKKERPSPRGVVSTEPRGARDAGVD
jgi:hypothetical protein